MVNRRKTKGLDVTAAIETCFEHIDRLRELKIENPSDYRSAIGYLKEVASGKINSPVIGLTTEMAETLLYELDEESPLIVEVSREEMEELLASGADVPEIPATNSNEEDYMGGDRRFISLDRAALQEKYREALQGYLVDED